MAREKSANDIVSALPEKCTQGAFAQLIGVSIRTVRDLRLRGVLKADKAGNIYVLAALHEYHKALRAQAQGRSGQDGLDLASERAKLTRLQIEEQEMKNATTRGGLLKLEDVKVGWGRFATVVRTSVLSIPSKARSRIPHMTAHDGEVLGEICRDVLMDAADEISDGAVPGAEKEPLTP